MFGSDEGTTLTVESLTADFLTYLEVEKRFAKESIIKYRDCLRQISRILQNPPVAEICKAEVLRLKADLIRRNLSDSRQTSIVLTLKRFLLYLREEKNLSVFDPALVTPPKRHRKIVSFLTPEEVARFVGSICLTSAGGSWSSAALRFRTLIEVILGSAMRISEVLSLNRSDIDFFNSEARIVGKGGKERTVFFTDRALSWIRRYLESRSDHSPALFVCQDGTTRLKRPDIWRYFARHRKLSGINKKVTPHLLRHTAATQLLFNGCPVSHIKEILGHERLETTCRYYLGLDQRQAKAAHRKYLSYVTETTNLPQEFISS